MGANENAAKGSAYCRKTESKGVHHVSLVAVKAALHMMTAAKCYFCHATQCVPCIPPDGYCNVDADCCYSFFCHASKCVYCLPSGGKGCAAHDDCCRGLLCDNQECV